MLPHMWKDLCIKLFIAALFVIAKDWKQPNIHQQESLGGWINKLWYNNTMQPSINWKTFLYTYTEQSPKYVDSRKVGGRNSVHNELPFVYLFKRRESGRIYIYLLVHTQSISRRILKRLETLEWGRKTLWLGERCGSETFHYIPFCTFTILYHVM